MLKRVKEERSTPKLISGSFRWSTGMRGCCPTSDHPKKLHRAYPTARVTITTTWNSGHRSQHYEDSCKCEFCGHEWQQEWMSAGF